MLEFVFVFLIFILTYCFFCVDSSKSGIQSILKLKLISFLEQIIPELIRKRSEKIIDYVVNKPNPIVQVHILLTQIIYLVIVIGLFVIFVLYGVYEFLPNDNIPDFWVYIGYSMLFFCLVLFYIACKSNPGVVTKKTFPLLSKKYQYDNTLYFNKECRTCKFSKYYKLVI